MVKQVWAGVTKFRLCEDVVIDNLDGLSKLSYKRETEVDYIYRGEDFKRQSKVG